MQAKIFRIGMFMMKKNWVPWTALVGIVFLLAGCGGGDKPYETGMELAKKGQYEEALPYFEEALKEKALPQYGVSCGMALNHLGRYEEAEQKINAALQEAKEDSSDAKQLYYAQTIARYGLGKYEEALECCDNGIKIDENEELTQKLRYTRVIILKLMGQYEEAREECLALLEKDKEYMSGYMELADIENCLGNEEEARKVYERAIEEDKDYYEAYFALADALKKNGQDAAARELLGKLAAIDSDDGEKLLAAGRAYAALEQYIQAEDKFNAANQKGISEALYYLGTVRHSQGMNDAAISSLEAFVADGGENYLAEGYCELAVLYMEGDRYKEAAETLKKGLGCGNSSARQNLLRNQVILYEKQNKYKKALKVARQYRKLYPSDKEMEKELKFIKTRL